MSQSVRHLFDQYSQPENRLTHALASSLSEDPRLLRSFLRDIAGLAIPRTEGIMILEQSLPGEEVLSETESERRGLPDAWIYTKSGIALLIESKVSASVSRDQLDRHLGMAKRRGFKDARLLVLSVKENLKDLPSGAIGNTWCDIYEWLKNQEKSEWAERLATYLEIAEAKLSEVEYLKEGTLTRFSGIPFNDEHAYSYLEAKRLLGLLMGELKTKPSIIKRLGADPALPSRGAIKKDLHRVWDYIRLQESKKYDNHTRYPHLTAAICQSEALALVTLPHGVEKDIRKRVFGAGEKAFTKLILDVAVEMRTVLKLDSGVKPYAKVIQRHYPTQSSPPIEDGILKYDLRTILPRKGRTPEKYQPEWLPATYEIMTNKKANIQFEIGVEIPYRHSKFISTRESIRLFEACFLAFKPFLDVALGR